MFAVVKSGDNSGSLSQKHSALRADSDTGAYITNIGWFRLRLCRVPGHRCHRNPLQVPLRKTSDRTGAIGLPQILRRHCRSRPWSVGSGVATPIVLFSFEHFLVNLLGLCFARNHVVSSRHCLFRELDSVSFFFGSDFVKCPSTTIVPTTPFGAKLTLSYRGLNPNTPYVAYSIVLTSSGRSPIAVVAATTNNPNPPPIKPPVWIVAPQIGGTVDPVNPVVEIERMPAPLSNKFWIGMQPSDEGAVYVLVQDAPLVNFPTPDQFVSDYRQIVFVSCFAGRGNHLHSDL